MEFITPGYKNAMGSVGLKFLPSQISGLKAWYRFNTGLTVTGSGVSQWDDASGNGNHSLQAADADRPSPGGLGSDVVVNGDFSADSDWVKGSGWTIASGVASAANAGASNLSQSGSLTLGVEYKITFTISNYVSGTLKLFAGLGVITSTYSANGTYTEYLTAASDGTIYIQSAGTASFDVDNVSYESVDRSEGVLCDGISQFLKTNAFTLNQPTTIYLLFKQITWASGEHVTDGNANDSGTIFQRNTTPGLGLFAGGAVGNVDLTLDTYGIISAVFNGASSVIQLNNETPVTGNSGASNMGGFTLGAKADGTVSAHAQFKEAMGFSGAHDAATRLTNINYLASVGGLSI